MPYTSPFRYPIGLFERWRRKLYCRVMRALGYSSYVMQAQGAYFLVDETDFIDRSIAYFAMWDGPHLDELARVCAGRQVDWFLDVGANLGFYSVMLVTKGLVKQAIAFDPDPGNYAHLLSTLYLNGLASRVRAYPYAVGDKPGTVTLAEAWATNRGESWVVHPDKPPEEAGVVAHHQVKQVRLDDEFDATGKTIVMKMDVEGSEFHALAGMHRVLTQNRCYVQVELYSDRIEDLKRVFADLGYRYVRVIDIDHFFTNMPDVE
jgi:FkbM family methyltransferase